jgi:hypothetical protein
LLLSDLQKNGITQNQTIANFQVEGESVADTLTKLALRCNPMPAESPAVAEQVLVWVVGPDPDKPGQSIVLITTREAAADKNFELPDVFKLPP